MLIEGVVFLVGLALWLIPPLLIARTASEPISRRVVWTIASLLSPVAIFLLIELPIQLSAVSSKDILSTMLFGWQAYATWILNMVSALAPAIVLWMFHRRRERSNSGAPVVKEGS